MFISNVLNTVLSVIFSLTGTLSLYVLFIVCRETNDIHINPVSLIINYVSIPCLIFIVPILYKQTKLILYGLTVKQYESILRHKKPLHVSESKTTESLDASTDIRYTSFINKLERITFCEKLKNLKIFFLNPIPESLLGRNYI